MNPLRGILAGVTVLALAGFVALAVFGGGFRRSFGASENHPLLVLLPPAVLVLFLASLVLPGSRPLLHATAAAGILLALGSLRLLMESPFPGMIGLGYAALWFVYYWLAVWAPRAAPPP